jgi:hypothetical protein
MSEKFGAMRARSVAVANLQCVIRLSTAITVFHASYVIPIIRTSEHVTHSPRYPLPRMRGAFLGVRVFPRDEVVGPQQASK